MKLIYYCDFLETYGTKLAIAVAAESNDVALILRNFPVLQERREDEALLHGRPHGVRVETLAGGYSSPRSFITLFKMYHSMRKDGYRLFHVQQTGDPRLLWLALRMRTVLTLHEPTRRVGVVSGAPRWLDVVQGAVERLYRRFADLIVVHTETGLHSLKPSEQKKAVVIPHGVDLCSVPAAHDSKTILFFGRATAYKGIDTLLAAMTEVWRTEPEARLRILASPGDYVPNREFDSRVHATWNGFSTQELEGALSTARAVCLPYRSASGTGVGAQAYGSGKPIVASDLDGLRELVTHGELLVEPDNVNDLARAIKAVLDRDYGVQPVDVGRTWPAVASAHIVVYQSLSRAPLHY